MERAEALPALPPDPAEVDLFTRPGPFLSAYVATEPAEVGTGAKTEQRWRSLRHHLAGRGAPDEVLDAVEPHLADAHLEGATLAVFVAGDRTTEVLHLPEPPARDLGRWGAVPNLTPVIESHQLDVPHVVVLVDRAGADLLGIARGGGEQDVEVEGEDWPIHKVRGAGWSQRRMQARVEDSWEHNAAQVAEAVATLATEVGARLVVVAGDDRASHLLRDHLPAEVAELVQLVPGGRSEDGSADEVADQVVRLTADVAARDTRAVLARFHEERDQHDKAADGPAATVGALREGRVAILLVDDDPDDEREAFIGPEPLQLALDRQELVDLGVAEPTPARLVDAVQRAAAGGGAHIRVVPAAGNGPQGKVGALLRW